MRFFVLPDTEDARNRMRAAVATCADVVLHPSGRPWIAGHWDSRELHLADAGHAKVALMGTADLSPDRLRKLAGGVRGVGDLDGVPGRVPGSFHLLATVGGHVRSQGTLATTRHLFHADVDGVSVAADRPGPLVELLGAEIEEERLALHLLAPFGPPWPLSEQTMWKGVEAVPPGEYLSFDGGAPARTVRWWSPPEGRLSLSEGAGAVAGALKDAVAARTSAGTPVSADLSGGMDSTTVSFLLAETDAQLVTLHNEALGAANDDGIWADVCRRELPDATHLTVRRGTGPSLYDPLTDERWETDGPAGFARARSLYENWARSVADEGVRRHLGGVGSDELFHPSVLSLTDLLRQRPLRAWPHVRRFRHRYRWGPLDTLRVLKRQRSFADWLGRSALTLQSERHWGAVPETDWELMPTMPPWATGEAVEAVAGQLARAAEQRPEPLAPLASQHSILRLQQVNGRAVRMNSRITERFGVELEAPFTDHQVIEAALSVGLEAHFSGDRPKPVLAAAMQGRVPHVLDRRTKGESSAEFYAAVRKNRADLERFCDESLLARRGLIDPDRMRAVVTGLHMDVRPFMPFDATYGVELWLRSQEERTGPAPAGRTEERT